MSAAVALGTLETGVELRVPVCKPGIGKVILSPASKDLIDGVKVQPFAVWPDDRGLFSRSSQNRSRTGRKISRKKVHQISAALNYPGSD